MNEQGKVSERVTEKDIFHAPWEKSFGKILTPFEEFVHRQATGGLLLIAKTSILAVSLLTGVTGFVWL